MWKGTATHILHLIFDFIITKNHFKKGLLDGIHWSVPTKIVGVIIKTRHFNAINRLLSLT